MKTAMSEYTHFCVLEKRKRLIFKQKNTIYSTMIKLTRSLLVAALVLSAVSSFAHAEPTYVGEMQDYRTVREDDTLIEIAYRENLGYVELRAANPSLDPWLPGYNEKVILPKQHLLPDAPHKDIVINLGEMRLYFYPGKGRPIQTYPLGIGREGLLTPKGTTTITRKKDKPSWSPTERMRKEKPELPATVGPGPDNPMGSAALYLGWPLYAIHGTNTPWGIGRRVSSGCLRMYNEDITKLYGQVPVGTTVTVVDQPVKTAWIDGRFYIEAHPNAYQSDKIVNTYEDIDYEVSEKEFSAIFKAVGEYKDQIDWKDVRKALRYRAGYPVVVSGKIKDNADKKTEDKPATTNDGHKSDNDVVADIPVQKVEPEDIKPSKKPWKKTKAQKEVDTEERQYQAVSLTDLNN